MTPKKPTIGILGAGKVGIVIAQLLLKAGYEIYIAGSEKPNKIKLSVDVLAPGAISATKETVASKADIIILALPLGKYRSIPKNELRNKIVIDAMNYWWEVDGLQSDLQTSAHSTSEMIQNFLPTSHVVKAVSHIGYHDLYDETRPKGSSARKAIAIAGNDHDALDHAKNIVNDLGFDPVYIGQLPMGKYLEPGSPVFGAHISATELADTIKNMQIAK